MVTLSLVALDSTVLATAVPTIVSELGDFPLFPWLFSGYLLAQAVTTPVYAKLSDVYGRKPVIVVGIGLFMVGSILCAVAWSMPALIVARAVQGVGLRGQHRSLRRGRPAARRVLHRRPSGRRPDPARVGVD
jgi:MFS family permease